MKSWPVPNSYSDTLPTEGDRGSYWEDRHIGFNCGVDIFCPPDSDVLVIESGIVLNISQYTERNDSSCFESTLQCVIKCNTVMYKYSFLNEISVKLGQKVEKGDILGKCKLTVIKERIKPTDPFYLRDIAHSGQTTYIHLEIFKSPIMEIRPYEYGNFLGEQKPLSLINPNLYLSGLNKKSQI